jgi:hypothetical protein
MAPETPEEFRVLTLPQFVDRVRLLAQRAVERGYLDRFRETLLTIQLNLQTNPAIWGEACYRLPHHGVTMYHRIHDFISVQYFVDDVNRIVWANTLQPLSNHPLAMDF